MKFNQILKSSEWTAFCLAAMFVVLFQCIGATWLSYLALVLYAVAFTIMALCESFFLYDMRKFTDEDWKAEYRLRNKLAEGEVKDEDVQKFVGQVKFWSIFRLTLAVICGLFSLVVVILY